MSLFRRSARIICKKRHPSVYSKKFCERKFICSHCNNELKTICSENDEISKKDIDSLPNFCPKCGKRLIKEGIIIK